MKNIFIAVALLFTSQIAFAGNAKIAVYCAVADVVAVDAGGDLISYDNLVKIDLDLTDCVDDRDLEGSGNGILKCTGKLNDDFLITGFIEGQLVRSVRIKDIQKKVSGNSPLLTEEKMIGCQIK